MKFYLFAFILLCLSCNKSENTISYLDLIQTKWERVDENEYIEFLNDKAICFIENNDTILGGYIIDNTLNTIVASANNLSGNLYFEEYFGYFKKPSNNDSLKNIYINLEIYKDSLSGLKTTQKKDEKVIYKRKQ